MFKVAVESQGCRSTCPSLAVKVTITKLAVLFLLAAGVARAESFTYTASFDSSGITPQWDMSLSFDVHRLLGDSGQQIKLKDVTLIERPTIFAPVIATGNAPPDSENDYSYLPVALRLISVTGSNLGFNAAFQYQIPCGPGDPPSVCTPGNYRWQANIYYSMAFGSPITGTGEFSSIRPGVDVWTNGNGPLGMSHNLGAEEGIMTVVDPPDGKSLATPEPSTGLMLVGASLLGVWLRKRS
jgi:hypothetical protein